MASLRTTDEAIDALGGNGPTGVIAGVSPKAVSNWRGSARGRFPPETYIVLIGALRAIGHTAPAALWQMIEPATDPSAPVEERAA